MEKPYILVLGASGTIGSKVAEVLCNSNVAVGVVGRDAAKLAKFNGRAIIWQGDFGDDAFMRQVLSKATALFLTVPDQYLQDTETTAKRLHNLLAQTKVAHIVNISNCIVEKNGVPTRLIVFETELDKVIKVPIIHVRSGNFFDNLNWGFDTPYHPELKLPYGSTHEVASEIAALLLKPTVEGSTVKVLLGPADFSMKELAEAAGRTYKQLPYTPENESFYRPFNEGNFKVEARTAANTSPSNQVKFSLDYFLKYDLKV